MNKRIKITNGVFSLISIAGFVFALILALDGLSVKNTDDGSGLALVLIVPFMLIIIAITAVLAIISLCLFIKGKKQAKANQTKISFWDILLGFTPLIITIVNVVLFLLVLI